MPGQQTCVYINRDGKRRFPALQNGAPVVLTLWGNEASLTDGQTGRLIGVIQDKSNFCGGKKILLKDASNRTVLESNASCTQLAICCRTIPIPVCSSLVKCLVSCCCCGPTNHIDMAVEDPNKNHGKTVSRIKKTFCCPSNYEVAFEQVQDPGWKANVVATAIYLDFNHFSDGGCGISIVKKMCGSK